MIRSYIDISAVSYVIPVIVGIAVAVGSWIYLHFRHAKSKVYKKLGIDENARKEVEDDVIVTDTSDAEKDASEKNGQNSEHNE